MEADPIDDHVRKQYDEKFDASFYLNEFYKELDPLETLVLDKLHEAFEKGVLEGPLKRCIDIGCGPVVHRMSAPSKVCETLVFSDYSQKNLDMINEWIAKAIPNPKHHHLFRYCAEKEGFEDLEKGAIEIETRIKSKVKGVVHVNVLSSAPIGQLDEPFDVAFSGACLESACDTYESYVEAVKNIASILRPGGYLILKGFSDGNYYVVNEMTFPCLNQNIEMIRKGLAEGGYRVLDAEELAEEHRSTMSDLADGQNISNCKSGFYAIAQKI